MKKRFSVNRGITSRWFFNSFSVVVILILLVDISVYLMLRAYYYNAATQYLQTEANIISGIISYYDVSSQTNAESVRQAVETFDKKSQMELMAINKFGKVSLMSSGFSSSAYTEMPDYKKAVTDVNGVGQHTGRLPNDEKYLAVCVTLPPKSGSDSYSAIRMVTSLEKIDAQVYDAVFIVTAISMLVLVLVLLMGLYFIKSIVSPIQAIGQTARKFAKGDFTHRVVLPAQNDEIGELCEIFNNMADEIESTEIIKNDFISSVSHELRTPLTAIKGWTETILESPEDLVLVEKGIKIVQSETERLSHMVEDLLDFSNIQNGRLKLQKANIDVLIELTEAVMVYTESASRSGIPVEYHDCEQMAVIYGDKYRLRQVFVNIIDNAIKYSPSGAKVDVWAKVDDKNIEILVEDNGVGISAEDLPKIKTRFYKANNSVRGSGIGLAVAEEIIEQHGGSLEIESELGVGTKVKITLPKLHSAAKEKGK